MAEGRSATIVIGVDCATETKKVGIAVATAFRETLRVEELFPTVQRSRATNVAGLVAGRVREARNAGTPVLLALDAPLGWPEAMHREFAGHAAGRPLATGRRRMFSRYTDRFVYRQTGKNPLDVGANLIAKTAHWTLELLEQVREATGEEIPLAWIQGSVRDVVAIEVYPALALLALARELDDKDRKAYGAGYKQSGDGGRIARQNIWDRLKSVPVRLPSANAPETDHEIDAVLCVQMAHEFLRCKCATPPERSPQDVVRREGWIWFSQESRSD